MGRCVSMDDDISKNTVLVLVVLTIVISLLGTWTVINEASKFRAQNSGGSAVSPSGGTAHGKVSITITRPPEPVSTTGKVVLNIVRNDKKDLNNE